MILPQHPFQTIKFKSGDQLWRVLLSEIGPTPYLLEVSTRRGVPDTLRDTH